MEKRYKLYMLGPLMEIFLILNKGSVFSFCTGCHKLCSQSCCWVNVCGRKGKMQIGPREKAMVQLQQKPQPAPQETLKLA